MSAKDLPISMFEDAAANDSTAQPGNFELLDEPARGAVATIRSTALSELTAVERGIAALKESYGGKVYDVQTTKGMEAAKAARVAIRTPIYRIPHLIKEKKAELKEAGVALDREGDRIKEALSEILEPINTQITTEETRKQNIKEAAAEAARKAKAELDAKAQDLIDAIRNRLTLAVGQLPDAMLEIINVTEAIDVTDAELGERAGEAMRAKSETIGKLREMHATAVAWEATQAAMREQQRLAAIQQDIDQFGRAALEAIGKPAAAILEAIAGLKAVEITVERFAERADDALSARTKAVAQLDALHTAALATEAAAGTKTEADRLEAQRQEQERTQAALDLTKSQQETQAQAIATARAKQITEAIEAIEAIPSHYTAAMSVEVLSEAVEKQRAVKLGVATFGGRIGAARTAQAAALTALEAMLAEATEREATPPAPPPPPAPAPEPAPAPAPETAPAPAAAVESEAPRRAFTVVRATATQPATTTASTDATAKAFIDAVAGEMHEVIRGLLHIVRESQGVVGYLDHRGVKPWEEFVEIERAEAVMLKASGKDDSLPF